MKWVVLGLLSSIWFMKLNPSYSWANSAWKFMSCPQITLLRDRTNVKVLLAYHISNIKRHFTVFSFWVLFLLCLFKFRLKSLDIITQFKNTKLQKYNVDIFACQHKKTLESKQFFVILNLTGSLLLIQGDTNLSGQGHCSDSTYK